MTKKNIKKKKTKRFLRKFADSNLKNGWRNILTTFVRPIFLGCTTHYHVSWYGCMYSLVVTRLIYMFVMHRTSNTSICVHVLYHMVNIALFKILYARWIKNKTDAKACWAKPELHVMILCVTLIRLCFFFVDSRRHESLVKLHIATAKQQIIRLFWKHYAHGLRIALLVSLFDKIN